MWVPFLRSFPGNEAHKLLSGGPKIGGLGRGGGKFMLKKFMCFFPPLTMSKLESHNRSDHGGRKLATILLQKSQDFLLHRPPKIASH